MKKFALSFLFLSISLTMNAQLTLIRTSENKFGFINLLGDTVVPAIYDYAEDFSEGLALVKQLKGYKLIDTAGNLWDLDKLQKIPGLRYDWGEYHSGMPVLVPIWKCAYIDITGKIAFEIPYQDAESFHDSKARVYKGDKYSYINRYGMLVAPWRPIPDDYRAVKYKGFYGYVNKNGKLVIDYQFRNAYDFKNGIAIASPDNIRWALINKRGKYISDFYDEIGQFENNIAVVRRQNLYGFINNTGKFVSGWYEQVQKVDSALYRVKRSGKFALVLNGHQVTKWYDNIERYNERYWLAQDGSKYAFLNNIGAYVVGWYDKLWTLEDYPDLVFVMDKNKYGFYNTHNFYISPMFDTLVFSEGIALVRLNGKYGFISMLGGKITEIIFDKATPYQNAVATVEKDGKVAYLDPKGNFILDWIDKNVIVKNPPPGLFVVKIGNKYGYQTLNGRRVIPAIYDYAEPFSEGLALVKMYPKIMLIDTLGQLKPTSAYPKDKSIRLDWGYRHTLKPIKIKVWQYLAYLDPNGKVALKLPPEITDAESFNNGRAKVYKGDKFNYIDKQGNILGQWQEVPDDYHVSVKGGKFGFINKNNRLVIPYKFDYAYDFHNGIAKVQINGKWTYINTKGEPITDLYDDISDFTNGVAIVKQNGKYAIIDTAGQIISQWYDYIGPFVDKMALVKRDGKYSFINIKGEQIPQWFEQADNFSEGVAKVKYNGKWGFINRQGKFIVEPQYDWASTFVGGIAKVRKGDKYTLINIEGKQITDWYDRIFFFADDRAVVVKDRKWGYIDINGRLVIPLIYDKAYAFTRGQAMVFKNGKQMIINKNGDIIKINE